MLGSVPILMRPNLLLKHKSHRVGSVSGKSGGSTVKSRNAPVIGSYKTVTLKQVPDISVERLLNSIYALACSRDDRSNGCNDLAKQVRLLLDDP